jgi:hypothetical protein
MDFLNTEDEDSKLLQNAGNCLPVDTTTYPRRPESSTLM